MRGFCYYKEVQSSLICEESLERLHEKENEKQKFAIAAYRNGLCLILVVGYVPLKLFKLLFKSVI